ncbi:MAG TPA: alpha-L-fucosidase, partial [Lacipirellulaceae bacterium]|nr:alpha-L-fucosidase [Lacipirellulaceae bacterium]
MFVSLRAQSRRILCYALLSFLGTGCVCAATDAPAGAVYLFTSFRNNGEDGLRFLYSDDGYRWQNIPGTFLKPRVGGGKLMRDPSLVQGPDGTFHLVWTTAWKGDRGFGYARSKDLVHWSEQRFIPVMEHESSTINVWAPELFYDEVNRQFVICWASTIPGRFPDHLEPHDNNQRLYYTTTRDFETFSPARLFFDPGFSVIDATIMKDGNWFVLVFKDNTRPQRNLRVAFGESALGPWRDVSEPFTGHFTEGPSVLKIGAKWLIFFDAYGRNSYGAVSTRDFRTFTDLSHKVSFPKGHKHGTVLRASRKLVDGLRKVGALQSRDARMPLVSALSASAIATRLAGIDAVIKAGPYRAEWDSLRQFQPPAWFRDAKFGIFIHWGAYSVP